MDTADNFHRFNKLFRDSWPAIREEMERLQEEVERLRKTCIAVTDCNGSVRYVQVYNTTPYPVPPEMGVAIKIENSCKFCKGLCTPGACPREKK